MSDERLFADTDFPFLIPALQPAWRRLTRLSVILARPGLATTLTVAFVSWLSWRAMRNGANLTGSVLYPLAAGSVAFVNMLV